ncbi:MAG: hypothetical protein VB055_09455 [Oscillospiraceae bacterium]|nr:hypothetical protein [Oscillospiraceae bacterium]
MLKAIIYTSNTGYTAEYAKLLGEKTGLPVSSLEKAETKISPSSEILYLGWLMAGTVKGYKSAAKRYRVRAVCAVGMAGTGTQMEEVRKKNALPDQTALFTLQGGFDIKKLHGIYKLMMSVMVKTVGKGLASKADRTPDEDAILEMMLHGGNHVGVENLGGVLEWMRSQER